MESDTLGFQKANAHHGHKPYFLPGMATLPEPSFFLGMATLPGRLRLERALVRLVQQRQRIAPAQALLAGADRGAVAVLVDPDPALPHLGQEGQRPVPLLALLARAHGGVVGDGVGLQVELPGERKRLTLRGI